MQPDGSRFERASPTARRASAWASPSEPHTCPTPGSRCRAMSADPGIVVTHLEGGVRYAPADPTGADNVAIELRLPARRNAHEVILLAASNDNEIDRFRVNLGDG